MTTLNVTDVADNFRTMVTPTECAPGIRGNWKELIWNCSPIRRRPQEEL